MRLNVGEKTQRYASYYYLNYYPNICHTARGKHKINQECPALNPGSNIQRSSKVNSKHRPRFLVERSQCVSTTLWCTWKSHALTNGTRKTNFREFNCQIQVLWNSFRQQQKIWGLVFSQNDSISELPRPLQLNPSSSWLWLRKGVACCRSHGLLMAELELNPGLHPSIQCYFHSSYSSSWWPGMWCSFTEVM